MNKRILSLILVVAMVSFMPVMASEAESGTCGNNLTWMFDDTGTLTISGKGDMKDYDYPPWDNLDIKKVLIEHGVTSIGAHAFYYCTSLTSITISDTVTSIGSWAFKSCSNIDNVYFSDLSSYLTINFVSVYSNPMCNANNLYINGKQPDGHLIIPDGVTNIPDYAFRSCDGITSITIPDSVINIGSNAFEGCYGLTEVQYNGSYKNIANISISSYNSSLTNAVIHCNDLIAVKWGKCGNNVAWFLNDSGTLTITGTGKMKDYRYDYTDTPVDVPWYNRRKNIKEVVVQEGVTSIGSYAFYMCSIANATIPDSVTSIGNSAFECCSDLKNITIPNRVTIIDDWAFRLCTSLPSMIIPDSVTNIGRYAFADCFNLTSIIIPNSVTNIDEFAFSGCGRLNITVDANNLNYSSIDGVLFNKDKSEIVEYAKDIIQPEYAIPDSVTSIGKSAFETCTSLTSITIPDNVTSIGDDAFHFCTDLTNVTIGSGLKSIGKSAFYQCIELSNIAIPNSVMSIGKNAFYDTKLYDNSSNWENGVLYISNHLIKARKDTISGSYKIRSRTKCIADGAFDGCDSLTNIIMPNSVTGIGDSAFWLCKGITDVYYNDSKADWQEIEIGSGNDYLTDANIHYNSIIDYSESVEPATDVDEYIIDEVKKYTSSGLFAQHDAIMTSNMTEEEKFRRLNELYNNEGLTDIHEGIKYLSETTSYRAAYNYLTTNEIYCAFNYFNWLNSNTAARAALYASGLIFNFEALSYLDLSTYTENDYPGVKKNKALLKEIMEINDDSLSKDVFDYSSKSAKFLKNLIKLNNITTDAEMDNLMDRILSSTSQEESQKLQKQFAEKLIGQINANDPNGAVDLTSENFNKALGISTSVIKFVGATADDIVALARLDSDIEIYKKYSRFLTTIYTTPEVSFEMRLAAYQFLNDINNGYYNKIVALLTNVVDLGKDLVYIDKSMLQTALENMGITESGSGLFADALGTLTLATYISNIVVDTGDFVKQVAYTQGYGELSTLYSLKLEDDKRAFLSDENAENAWTFFEDYTMLWNLRYGGEKQYLDMNKVKMFIFDAVPTYKYSEKEDVVDDNLKNLDKFKFKLSGQYKVPESVQYEKKFVVKCPVDVYVYNSSGDLIALLKDGVESNVVNEYGRFAVVRESYSGEYSKVICQSTNEKLNIKMVAVGNGLVDYQEATTESTEVKAVDKLHVEQGNYVEVKEDEYTVSTEAEGEISSSGVLVTKDTDNYIKVESAELTDEHINLAYGESKSIGITITPDNATNTAVDWISLNKDIATVQNGVVIGTGGGSTTIIARICDSDEIECELTVDVEPAPTEEPTSTPTTSPTEMPIATPTVAPTATPTASPTAVPTATPTTKPTATPTVVPTACPTATPTVAPTATPTASPTATPTVAPTATPTAKPTATPTVAPTTTPTESTTTEPTETPEPYNYPYKIVSAKVNNGTIVFNMKKYESAPPAQIIFAEYDGSTLKRVQVDTISFDRNTNLTKTFEYSGRDYKVFIWDDLGTMTPLAEMWEYIK